MKVINWKINKKLVKKRKAGEIKIILFKNLDKISIKKDALKSINFKVTKEEEKKLEDVKKKTGLKFKQILIRCLEYEDEKS